MSFLSQLRYKSPSGQLSGDKNVQPGSTSLGADSGSTLTAGDHGWIIAQRYKDALTAARAIQPGHATWSDGPRLENGRNGAGNAWQELPQEWESGSFPLEKGQVVF
uniref:Uncharacterized protein n=1 Tax=Coccidioides posadasii RMSCC 3488 TaxID=454284 RepID=A0A0J6FUX3_COCPO|nr:hypothetical protein CPAG_09249 [Coccidioides posadasii RMSCC 3488]